MSPHALTCAVLLSALSPVPTEYQWHWWAVTTTLIWSYHVTSILPH